MKVESIKSISPNKRERISGGVYIEFKSTDNVKKGDYFKVIVNGSNHEFEASEVQVEGTDLKVTAKEVGYWAKVIVEVAKTLEHKGTDLRTVIGSEVTTVTDEVEKKRIYERTCWL